MRTIVKGKNFEVPAADRNYAQAKLSKLERVLDDRTDALVEISTESHRSPQSSHIVEVTLVIDGTTLRGEASAATHRAAIDEVVDKLERRAVDYKQRPLLRRRPQTRKPRPVSGDGGSEDAVPVPVGDEGAPSRRVVKTKRFGIEPMFEEDAVSRMEELGHSFFLFVNAENEQLAVLYRRRDGDYGLIEPTVGGAYTTGRGNRSGQRPG